MKMKNKTLLIIAISFIIAGIAILLFINRPETGYSGESDSGIGEIGDSSQSTSDDCEGTKIKFDYAPVNLEKTTLVVPLGLMSGNHVTPVDHQYFQNFDNKGYNIEIYSPGDGYITNIQHMPGAKNGEDYRIVIEHTCTVSSIYIHLGIFSEKFKEYALSNNGYANVRIPVKGGELLGYYETNVDYNVVDTEFFLDGFITPEYYESEAWKIHVPDTLEYFNDPVRSQIIEKSLRATDPISGKFDWDVDGTLQGNWFVEGSKGYDGLVGQQYWDTHLSFSPNYLDYSHFIISMGDFDGRQEQFGAKGNEPNPLDISLETGIVTYELVTYDYYSSEGIVWDRRSLIKNLEARNNDFVQGVVLVEMIENQKIKFESFPGKTALEVNSFTNDAKIYIR